MSIRNKILDFYRDLLASTMVAENEEDGSLFYQASPESPATTLVVGEKKLRFPRAEYMREPNDDFMYFHPLGEDSSLGESPVFQQLTNLITAKLTLSLMSVPNTIISIANLHSTGADVRGKMTAKQVELIASISGTDNLNDKIADKFGKVVLAATKDPNTRPIKITIRRNAKRYGEDTVYRRAAIVTFPLLAEIIKKSTLGEDTIHGQKFSKYEMRLMINIYKTLFPSCDVEDQYSVFSDSPHAPNLTALLLAYADLNQGISKAVRAFESYLPDYDTAENDWYLQIAKIPEYASVIPTARGNEGVVIDDRGQLISRDYDEPKSKAPAVVREIERSTAEERKSVRLEEAVDVRSSSSTIESRDGRFAAIPISAAPTQGRVKSDDRDESPARSSPSSDLAAALREELNRPRARSRDRDDEDDRDYRRDRDDDRDYRRDRDYDRDYRRDRDDDRGRRSSRDDDYDRVDRRDRADDYHRSALRSRSTVDDRDRDRDRDDRDYRRDRDYRGYSHRR